MASNPNPKASWVSVKAPLPTRPLPTNSRRPAVITDRLIIRALVPEDLQGLHTLRTQPEVMANNPQGRIDKGLKQTQPRLDLFLPPNDEKTFNFAVCLKDTNEMIGVGGCQRLCSVFGWPALGYMFRKECWGKGIATEFVQAWLNMWCELPREETVFDVDPRTLPEGDGPLQEQITSFTVSDNFASRRVLEKCGFEHFLTRREPDLRNPDVEVVLMGYRYYPTKQ